MTLHKIWRLEDQDGHGPFVNQPGEGETDLTYQRGFIEAVGWGRAELAPFISFLPELTVPSLVPDATHPNHTSDVPLPDYYDQHHWKVGCKSLRQLAHWFPKRSFPFFEKYGFHLAVYECDCADIHFGKYQVLFCVDRARRL